MRIENRHGGGVPDVHGLIDKLPFWAELKVTKLQHLKISPHQVAWHTCILGAWRPVVFLAKGPFATLFCSFSGFGIDRSGPKTMDRGPRPKVRGPWVDVGGPARRGAWTLCADRALRAVNLGPARGCPAPCASFLLLIIEKRPEIRGPRAGGRALSGDGRGLAINGSGVSLLSPLRKCRKGRMLRAIRRMRLSLQSA
jgi:hypothetical protein